jgi:hypothetical protein
MNAKVAGWKLGVRKDKTSLRVAVLVIAACAILLFETPEAVAQGCAMCYQNAAASGAQGREALRHGILILLFPTVSLFLGIFGLIYSRRNASR